MTQHGRGTLPGGLPADDGIARDYAFRPADGALELAIGETAQQAASMPEAVSLALEAALQSLAAEAPTRERIDALCVADRQFLMRELAGHLGDEGGWFHAECIPCGARFDFHLKYAELPVKPAGPGFPRAEVRIGRRRLSVRLPTGGDQIRVLAAPPRTRRAHLLAALLGGADAGRLAEKLDAAARGRIEAALEAVAPAVVCEVGAPCPECGHANRVAVNPYAVLGRSSGALLGEVHRLAWHYHWSEAQILALPQARRRHYLSLIDQTRGMAQ